VVVEFLLIKQGKMVNWLILLLKSQKFNKFSFCLPRFIAFFVQLVKEDYQQFFSYNQTHVFLADNQHDHDSRSADYILTLNYCI